MGKKETESGRQEKLPSFRATLEIDEKQVRSQKQVRKIRTKGIHMFSWLTGIILALIPLLICEGEYIVYSDNSVVANRITAYKESFYGSGSILWIGVTLLAMAWIDMLLHGMKRGMFDKLICKVVLVISGVFIVIGFCVFTGNITAPISLNMITLMSWIMFCAFAIVSGIIDFVLVKED